MFGGRISEILTKRREKKRKFCVEFLFLCLVFPCVTLYPRRVATLPYAKGPKFTDASIVSIKVENPRRYFFPYCIALGRSKHIALTQCVLFVYWWIFLLGALESHTINALARPLMSLSLNFPPCALGHSVQILQQRLNFIFLAIFSYKYTKNREERPYA